MLIQKDKDGVSIRHYVCHECLGQSVIRWRGEGENREQFVLVNHQPNCNTGINAYNQVHNNQRQMN